MTTFKNAGTLADLLVRNGYCHSDGVERWFIAWQSRITVNDVPACSPHRVLEFGDVVVVSGETYRL